MHLIFRNDDLIVIDKPGGSSFHDELGEKGLFNLAIKHFDTPLWPVHRLDKLTSGLLIFATSKRAAAEMGEQFASRKISKSYLAISDRKPKKKQGKISGDMLKARNGSWKLSLGQKQPAITQFMSRSLSPGFRLYLLKPLTGKTHQLRVALKSVSAPILGDTRYAGTESDRGYLHAYRLAFVWQGKPIEIQCLPSTGERFQGEDFNNALTALEAIKS